MKFILWGLVIGLLLVACGKTNTNYTIEEIDGINYIHNNEIPLTELDLVPELIIGSEDAESDDVYFSRIAQVLEAPSGKIYILDAGDNSVTIFDYNGKFLQKIGRTGQGPGEFNTPLGLTIKPNGNLLVADYNNHRYQIFDTDGNYVNSYKVETDFPGRICYNKQGQLINHNTSLNFDVDEEEPFFYVYDDEFKEVGTIGVKQHDEDMMAKYLKNICFFDVNSKNNILGAVTAKNEFIFFEDGKAVRKFDRYLNYKPKNVEVKTVQDGDNISMTASYEPVCFGIAIDSNDNIYALTKYNQPNIPEDEKPDYYAVLEIYDPSGIQLKRIPLKDMAPNAIALGKDSKIYIVDDENNTIMRFSALKI